MGHYELVLFVTRNTQNFVLHFLYINDFKFKFDSVLYKLIKFSFYCIYSRRYAHVYFQLTILFMHVNIITKGYN